MPYLLRKVRRGRWLRGDDLNWLSASDVQAEAFDDLRAMGNELSVYHIEDDCSNLVRVSAALAANTDFPANFDYALIDEGVVRNSGVKITASRGESPDAVVNTWHSDMIELSAASLYEFLKLLNAHARFERIAIKKVIEIVADSILSGKIHRDDLRWKTDREKLETVIAAKSRLAP